MTPPATHYALAALLAVVAVFAPPFAAEAQQAGRVYRIGLLGPGGPGGNIDEFRRGLSERGYVEGQNIHVESRWADNIPPAVMLRADEVIE